MPLLLQNKHLLFLSKKRRGILGLMCDIYLRLAYLMELRAIKKPRLENQPRLVFARSKKLN